MMTACRDLSFPLVIVCLAFIVGYTPMLTTAEVVGTTTTDYDDPGNYEYTTFHENPPSNKVPLQRCDYDTCLDNQLSCAVLAASTGCLCPGFTLHNEIPLAPQMKAVSWNGSEVIVQWCAPYSYVTAFIVTVGEKGRWEFNYNRRRGSVGDIKHIAEVCVVAVNNAGDSERSCMMYHPKDNSLPLKAGLIGGALGFLLLLLLAVLLWRHKRQRKQDANISMRDTAETP